MPSALLFSFVAYAGTFPGRPLSLLLKQVPQRPEVQVELGVLESERRLQLLHALLEPHERLAEPLDLVLRERALLHPPDSLTLHQLTQELDQRQNQLRQ